MNILLLGSGGREHALAWKIAQSPLCTQLYIAPGNSGTEHCGINVAIQAKEFDALYFFCIEKNIELIVCGPEDPLVAGAYDFFTDKGIAFVGPSQAAAQLEGSKSFSKRFMKKYGIPTAAYLEINNENIQKGIEYIQTHEGPYVLKADGLAAGKGVLIISSPDEAILELKQMIQHAKFGNAGSKVVIEEFLDGIEFSVFVLSDGIHYKILPNAKDYKRIGEKDTGLNTGGMGAVSPVPFVDEHIMKQVETNIIQTTIQGLRSEGLVYKGFIYFGLIKVNDQIKVIEYNCRMGDPETEVVMPRIKSDIVPLYKAVCNGTLDKHEIEIRSEACCTVVLASGGYPEEFQKGYEIKNIPTDTSTLVFHAGIKKEQDILKTNGGRVAMVSAIGSSIKEAMQKANTIASEIQFTDKYYRRDIGYEFL